jgi:ABC-type transport system substrate-binding protein
LFKSTGVTAVRLDLIYLRPSEGASEDLNRKAVKSIEQSFGYLNVLLNIIPLDKNNYYQRLFSGRYDLALYEWSSGLNPSVGLWEPRGENEHHVPQNPANVSGYLYGGKYHKEYKKAIETVKFGRRDAQVIKRAYHFIHTILHEETAAIFLWNRNLHIAINKKYQYTLIKDPINFLKSVKDWGCPDTTQ